MRTLENSPVWEFMRDSGSRHSFYSNPNLINCLRNSLFNLRFSSIIDSCSKLHHSWHSDSETLFDDGQSHWRIKLYIKCTCLVHYCVIVCHPKLCSSDLPSIIIHFFRIKCNQLVRWVYFDTLLKVKFTVTTFNGSWFSFNSVSHTTSCITSVGAARQVQVELDVQVSCTVWKKLQKKIVIWEFALVGRRK